MSYTVLSTDRVIVVANAADAPINLPAATATGRLLYVKNAASAPFSIAPGGSDTIDGQSTLALNPGEAALLYDYAAPASPAPGRWAILSRQNESLFQGTSTWTDSTGGVKQTLSIGGNVELGATGGYFPDISAWTESNGGNSAFFSIHAGLFLVDGIVGGSVAAPTAPALLVFCTNDGSYEDVIAGWDYYGLVDSTAATCGNLYYQAAQSHARHFFNCADGGAGHNNCCLIVNGSSPNSGSCLQLHVYPTGTLASPPSGLYPGDVWADTTTSTTHPILRLSTVTT